ncbi:MAG: hypothetical protein JO132_08865, partial [Streptosporangiaceae bacterium]|nr:hypothetical protein [Streptosporangiaceae bacterium]
MTQDQYGEGQGPGAVPGDEAAENEAGETGGQSRPMTRFQKVASALLGDRTDRDESAQEQAAPDDAARDYPGAPDETGAGSPVTTSFETATGSDAMAPGAVAASGPAGTADTAGMAGTAGLAGTADQADAAGAGTAAGMAGTAAGAAPRDYWDEPEDSTTAGDYVPTQPDMYGTSGRPDDESIGAGTAPAAAGAQGAATVAAVPAAGSGAVPAGRHAADPAEGEMRAGEGGMRAGEGGMRPGDAAAALGDFSDLSYGNLIPDAGQYQAQWQQIQ